MEAEVPASSLKTFYRALQCLGSIGEDIWVEARADRLELMGKNAAQSAYAKITFPAAFFDAYDAGGADDTAFRCRVQARQLAGIFRARTHAVERCVLRIEQSAEPVRVGGGSARQGECRLVVHMEYQQRVCRTHRLFYEVCETFHSTYDRRDCKGRWRVPAAHAAAWVAHFARRAEELTLRMTQTDVRLRSWADLRAPLLPADAARALHTELTIPPADFEVYHVSSPTELTVALREFRAVLRYAERMATPLAAFFDRPGWPLLLEVSPSTAADACSQRSVAAPTAEFVLATVADDAATPATNPPHAAHNHASPIESHAGPRHAPAAGSPAGSPIATASHALASPYAWSPADRSDSLLMTPASVTARRAATATAADSIAGSITGSVAGSLPSSLSGLASQPLPNSRAPIARSYRLLDMPRPHAPPGLTDSFPSDEHASASGSSSRAAPPGMVQTTLPFQTTATVGGAVTHSDSSSDEDLDATPPPPSKRLRPLF